MKHIAKRLAALMLALVLCLAPAAAAQSAAPDTDQPAQQLYDLGLFRGSGTKADGSPEFSLERPASRAEALVMLIRLLGREHDAITCQETHPFSDVEDWADRYVAYGYSQGLTKGVGGGLFGSDQEASANMYLTFVLRALGYDDSAPDTPYTYDTASSYAQEIGLAVKDYSDGDFLRREVAEVSLRALNQQENGSENTLIQSLVRTGAVGVGAALRQGFEVDPQSVTGLTVSVPAQFYGQVYDSLYRVSPQDLLSAFPDAWFVTGAWLNRYNEVASHFFPDRPSLYSTLLLDEPDDLRLGANSFVTLYAYSDDGRSSASHDSRTTYVLDRDFNVIGYHEPVPKAEGESSAVLFTRTFIETASTVEQLEQRLSAGLAHNQSADVRVDWSDPQSSWDDGTGMARTYPVYVDGKEITTNLYLAWQYFPSDTPLADAVSQLHRNMLLDPPYMKFADGSCYHLYFSDEGRYDYGQAWDSQGNLVETHFGVHVSDSLLKEAETMLVVAVYDKNENMLGYTVRTAP